MARYGASDCIFSMDQPGGSLTAYHEGLQSINWSMERDNSQDGNLGSNNIKKAYTGKDAVTGELVVVRDASTNSLYEDLETWMNDSTYRGTAFSIRVEAPDGETDSHRYDMEIKLTGMSDHNQDANSGDPATVTFAFAVDETYGMTVIT